VVRHQVGLCRDACAIAPITPPLRDIPAIWFSLKTAAAKSTPVLAFFLWSQKDRTAKGTDEHGNPIGKADLMCRQGI